MDTIVLAFDDSEVAGRALEHAAEIAEALDAALVVAAVVVPPVPGPGVDSLLPGTSERLAEEATEELDLAEQQLEQARRRLEGREVRAEFVAQVGAPADAILDLAEERQADMIVISAEHTGFLERLLEGSVTDAVAHHTRRDVLIVH